MGQGPAFAPLTLKDYVRQMRPIPGGTCLMRAYLVPSDDKLVRLSPFRMGATPVTVGMWMEYCRATGTRMPVAPRWGWKPNHPMVNVSWNDIMGADGKGGFCAWASGVAGVRLTLPTEAQWEYCARDGGKPIKYPWGNRFDASKCWCSRSSTRLMTAPVDRTDSIYRNGLGLTDMVGNVWEWCSDWYNWKLE